MLTVGAIDLLNIVNTVSYEASEPTPDGHIKPELQVPSGITTAYNGCEGFGSWCPANNDVTNNDFSTVDGASLSTPIVTGATYLLKKQLNYYGVLNPQPDLNYSWLIALTGNLQILPVQVF
ncbi:unnamed protein product [Rotaria sp. Silwood2]|nr:unnamed protein product [Rotaria sp. Silwood2]